MENELMIYPKKDIKNIFNQIIYHKDKGYEAYKLKDDIWLIKCELIGCEYPMEDWKFIEDNFNFNKNCG
jgi:hypothetical protein